MALRAGSARRIPVGQEGPAAPRPLSRETGLPHSVRAVMAAGALLAAPAARAGQEPAQPQAARQALAVAAAAGQVLQAA